MGAAVAYCPWLLCYLLLIVFCGGVTVPQLYQGELVSVSEVTVLQEAVAHLPCVLQPEHGDVVELVLWFKDGADSPIYSMDARSPEPAQHWADDKVLGARAYFRSAGNASHLTLQRVREDDAGSYRCRVDFRRSPTRNSIINLAVIVPPSNVTIVEERGTPARDVIGPYPEGATPEVTCVVYGGRPRPRVSWWLGGQSLQSRQQQASGRRVSSVVRLPPLGRHHLLQQLLCRASNHQQPLTAAVTIDMLLAPVTTRLLGKNRPLSAGQTYEVACESLGSRPPARISWSSDGEPLSGDRQTVSADGNATTSVLPLRPRARDAGRHLCCSGDNPRLPAGARRDCWKLAVRYSPVVSLELGSGLNASAIREGDDVYLECRVRADPWVTDVVWTHDGKQVQTNASAGTLLSNLTLVLQAVRRHSAGRYSCRVANDEGRADSSPLTLDVKYAPECAAGQQTMWGAARREPVSVPCEVDARPPATLFRWAFNSSAASGAPTAASGADAGAGGSAPVATAPAAVTTQPGRSVATHTPLSDADYGTLLCWGRNEVGVQQQPCVFQVVPAGPPDPPRDCRVSSRSATSLQVSCMRGSDGGLPPQQFTLELLAARGGRLVANVTSRASPEFTLAGLEPATSYRLRVFSSNGKGRSDSAAELQVTTPSASTGGGGGGLSRPRLDQEEEPPVPVEALLLAGVLVALLLVGIPALLLALRMRRARLRAAASQKEPPPQTPATVTTEDNPDVIPNEGDVSAGYLGLLKHPLPADTRQLVSDSPTPTPTPPSVVYPKTVAAATHASGPVVLEAACWPVAVPHPQPLLEARPPPPALPLPLLKTSAAGCRSRHDAGTQTPHLARHKESAV
ncbi:nephrin-like [Schistocerca gregaria]|uniref:nephrin-like n=1 Tax=Schistocerca gregaria TaxID=7010 RepID=UPI00211F1ECB|nr:nephrin-like [Schistocerca gregaria]